MRYVDKTHEVNAYKGDHSRPCGGRFHFQNQVKDSCEFNFGYVV